MLDVIGADTLEGLLGQTIPSPIRTDDSPLALPPARTEAEVLAAFRDLAAENHLRTSLIGMGYAGNATPGVIQRNVSDPAWYTAYTPYQPEISQGRLEALLNFQTMVSELTGLEVANASAPRRGDGRAEDDGPPAVEGIVTRFVVHHDTRPADGRRAGDPRRAVGIELVVGDIDELAGGCFGALFGLRHPPVRSPTVRTAIGEVHDGGGIAVVATDLLACTLITPPEELGADIAVGSAQRFGVPMGFGGPDAPFVAAHASAAQGDARPSRRGEHRHRGPTGVAPRPADPRATHPPRKSDLEHLHRPGAARQHRWSLRLLARPRRATGDGRADPRPGRPPGWPTPSPGPASASVTPVPSTRSPSTVSTRRA